MFNSILVEPQGPPYTHCKCHPAADECQDKTIFEIFYLTLDIRVPATVNQWNEFPGDHPKMLFLFPTSHPSNPRGECTPPNSLSQIL